MDVKRKKIHFVIFIFWLITISLVIFDFQITLIKLDFFFQFNEFINVMRFSSAAKHSKNEFVTTKGFQNHKYHC